MTARAWPKPGSRSAALRSGVEEHRRDTQPLRTDCHVRLAVAIDVADRERPTATLADHFLRREEHAVPETDQQDDGATEFAGHR